MPKPEKAMVVLWAPSERHWSRLKGGAVAAVMAVVAVPVAEVPVPLVTLQLRVTVPVAPGVKAMLSVAAPTMTVPLVTVQA